MPFFYKIESRGETRRRIASKLITLRDQLDRDIPQRTVTDTLLLATWNIREFDSDKYGNRGEEAFSYIAEIISRFDLVAVQEVREDLSALETLAGKLGPWWRFLVTDVTEGRRGNAERMAFLFDGRKVRHGGLAGELVLPPSFSRVEGYAPTLQFARTPFIAGFRAGWFRFMLSTVHILYGTSEPDDPQRIEEIQKLATLLKKRARDRNAWSNNLILLGDFNIFNPADPTFLALTDNSFVIPDRIQALPANVARNKHYDQIAFMLKRRMDLNQLRAGVFNFFENLYLDDEEQTYMQAMDDGYHTKSNGQPRTDRQKRSYYRSWRTFQMSDHLPMWVELPIEFGQEYLEGESG
ncbi:MAG: endonuclease/exonuclease/phosphatase family protein [Candidatus Zixiibacteriota bacterium]|nr:MAG: endonuclease/exonuclease/phosphatase family protein [candidate division Zixibacteria bacterium]